MPHVSSRKLKIEVLNKLYKQFNKAFERSARKSQSILFLGDFLTKTEKVMLAKRFAVIHLLSQGVPVSYIAESLGMSYTTINRMSLNCEIGKYYTLIRAIKSDKEKIWKILEEIVRLGLPPRVGRGRWKFLYKHTLKS